MSRNLFYREAKELSIKYNIPLEKTYPKGSTDFWKSEVERIKEQSEGINYEEVKNNIPEKVKINRHLFYREAKELSIKYNIPLEKKYPKGNASFWKSEVERIKQQSDILNYEYDGSWDKNMHDIIKEDMKPNKIYNAVFVSGDNIQNIENGKNISKKTTKREIWKILKSVVKIYNYDAKDDKSILSFIPEVNEIPRLENLKDGFYNCSIGPLIFHLYKNNEKKHKSRIKKLEKLNEQYLKEGVNNENLQNIANVSGMEISIVDKLHNDWAIFKPNRKKPLYKIIFECRNKHLISQYESKLININSKEDLKFTAINYKKEEKKDKEIVFLEDNELLEIYNKYKNSNPCFSRDKIISVETLDTIYKHKFEQYEIFPKCYTDAGVGKHKFLLDNPKFENYETNKFDKLLLKSNIISFYERKKPSKKGNTKYDMNKSYKSVINNSPIFNGIPETIEKLFQVDKYLSDIELNFNGLVFVNDLSNNYKNTGWFPVEIAKFYLEKYNDNPFITQIMYCSNTKFNIDSKKYTNKQFRNFIGKTYSKIKKGIWQTRDYAESLKARYELRDRIIGFKYDRKTKIYTIHYKLENDPWAVPIIWTYIINHQKFLFLEQYKKLERNNIEIFDCAVDGIEVNKKCDELFDIGKKEGQWKIEKIKFKKDQTPYNYEPDENKQYRIARKYDKEYDLAKYTHFSGAGGNGKTYKAIELNKVYADIGFCAPTYIVCRNFKKEGIKAKTIYKMFNIRNEKPPEYHNIYVIDECSMISKDDFDLIMKKLKKYNPEAKLILLGDFEQLPPIGEKETIIENKVYYSPHEKLSKSKYYKKFNVIELKKNYRQKEDEKFYRLCNMLRSENFDKKNVSYILETLNKRVIKNIDKNLYNTENDIYICATNEEVNTINKQFENLITKKAIVNKTFTINNEILPCGLSGEITENIFTAGDTKKEYILSKTNMKNISLNYSSTIHKAQGKTIKGNVIIKPDRLFSKGHLYVALTRAKKLENIYLTSEITKDLLNKVIF